MLQNIDTTFGKATIYKNGEGDHIVVVPGYSESITHNRQLVDAIAKKGGYDVLTFSQPRKNALVHPLDRQRDIILSVLDASLDADVAVHGVAHSLGSLSLLRAAALRPERFKSLILMQPPGITAELSLLQLARRVSRKTTNNHINTARRGVYPSASLRHVLRSLLSSFHVIARNPRLALKEANVARKHSLADDIASVRTHGIPMHVITAHGDELFSVKDELGYEQIVQLDGSFSSLLDKTAGHDTFWMHPEQTAELVDSLVRLSCHTYDDKPK